MKDDDQNDYVNCDTLPRSVYTFGGKISGESILDGAPPMHEHPLQSKHMLTYIPIANKMTAPPEKKCLGYTFAHISFLGIDWIL